MKKFRNLDIIQGLKNDINLVIPELLERILYELEKTNKRLNKLEHKQNSKKRDN